MSKPKYKHQYEYDTHIYCLRKAGGGGNWRCDVYPRDHPPHFPQPTVIVSALGMTKKTAINAAHAEIQRRAKIIAEKENQQ